MTNPVVTGRESGLKKYLGTTHPAVIAVWAALIAVANLLPSIPLIGTGGTFSVSAALLPLAGIFFGPIPGAICAAIGQFIGQIIAPHIAWLGMGTFVIGTTNALVAGLVSRKNWLGATLVTTVFGLLWFTTAIGRQAVLFPIVVYGSGIVIGLVGALWGARFLEKDNAAGRALAIWLAAYAGFMGAAAVGNYLGILVVKIPAKVWNVLAFVTPVERTIFSVGAMIIGIPLLVGLPKIGIFVGPQPKEEDDD